MPPQKGIFWGLPWPKDCSSEFEYESEAASSTYSLDDESIISDDLDLYEDMYVR